MNLRILVILLVVLSLSGCATTKKKDLSGEELRDLRAKVSVLEDELADKDRAISSLEDELAKCKKEKSKAAVVPAEAIK